MIFRHIHSKFSLHNNLVKQGNNQFFLSDCGTFTTADRKPPRPPFIIYYRTWTYDLSYSSLESNVVVIKCLHTTTRRLHVFILLTLIVVFHIDRVRNNLCLWPSVIQLRVTLSKCVLKQIRLEIIALKDEYIVGRIDVDICFLRTMN